MEEWKEWKNEINRYYASFVQTNDAFAIRNDTKQQYEHTIACNTFHHITTMTNVVVL